MQRELNYVEKVCRPLTQLCLFYTASQLNYTSLIPRETQSESLFAHFTLVIILWCVRWKEALRKVFRNLCVLVITFSWRRMSSALFVTLLFLSSLFFLSQLLPVSFFPLNQSFLHKMLYSNFFQLEHIYNLFVLFFQRIFTFFPSDTVKWIHLRIGIYNNTLAQYVQLTLFLLCCYNWISFLNCECSPTEPRFLTKIAISGMKVG